MRDGIIKADGTSRLLRADLPATYEELRTKAAAGEQPLDVLFNSAGWSQQPTFLNKANLLQDTTAALFGLGSGAVPDEVLSKARSLIESADKTVLDRTTGKLCTITTQIDGLTQKFIPEIVSNGSMRTPATSTAYYPQYAHGYVRGNLMDFVCLGNDSKFHYVQYDLDTLTVVHDDILLSETYDSSTSKNTYVAKTYCHSCDDEVVVWLIGGNYHLIDLSRRVDWGPGNTVSSAFNTQNYWGYYYRKSTSSQTLYYSQRGSYDTVNSISFSKGAAILCTYGDTLLFADQPSDDSIRINKIDFTTGAVTYGIETLDFSKFGAVSSCSFIAPALVTKTHVYFIAKVVIDNITYRLNKLIEVDIATGKTNLESITGITTDLLSSWSVLTYVYYMGSIGTKAYYFNTSEIYVWDRTTDELECISIPKSYNYVAYRYNAKETVFDIPELPGIIPYGSYYFDTNRFEMDVMAAGMYKTATSSVSWVPTCQYLIEYPMWQVGDVVTTLKCAGFLTSGTDEIAAPPVLKRVIVVDEYKQEE